MNIAFIGLRGVPAAYSGVERAVEEIGARLVERGHQVTVYCMANRYEERLDSYRGMSLRYIPSVTSKNLEMICYAAASTADALRRGFDIHHFHALGPSTFAWLPRLLGKKSACTVHGLDWMNSKWGLPAKKYLQFGEFSARRFPHRTIVVSKELEQRFRDRGCDHASYIPNGMIEARPLELGAAGDEFGIAPQEYLLYVGRLTHQKRVHQLISAFRTVETDKKLVIVGGAQAGDPCQQVLDDLAAADDRVILTGPIYDDRVQRLLSHAYLFTLPSALEGLPIAVIEALSYGNAVLVSDIRANLEVIEDGDALAGFTFPVDDEAALAEQLRRLCASPNEVAAMQQKGRELVARKYDWDRITDETLQVYAETLGAPSLQVA
jgi:glycosyltransferase involved in cell wall biosynthesis